jgi:uncharacterized protein YjiS (DUF1127 family)
MTDHNAYRTDFTGELSHSSIDRQARAMRAKAMADLLGRARRAVARLAARLSANHRREVAVRRLSALDDRLLADLGLDRANIRFAVEAAQARNAAIAAKSAGDFNAGGQVARGTPANLDVREEGRHAA